VFINEGDGRGGGLLAVLSWGRAANLRMTQSSEEVGVGGATGQPYGTRNKSERNYRRKKNEKNPSDRGAGRGGEEGSLPIVSGGGGGGKSIHPEKGTSSEGASLKASGGGSLPVDLPCSE